MTLNTTYSPAVADGNGVTKQFSYSFNPISINYLKVSLEISGQWVQQLSGWTATVSENGGIVTFDVAPTTRVAIERDVPEEQPTSYETSSGFQAKVIEHSFDMLTGMVQELKEKSDRSVSVEVGSPISPEQVVQQIERVYTSIDNVDAVADDLANVDTVASDLTNINKVAGSITNVNKVGNNITNVNAVGSNISNVNTVAGDHANIQTVVNNMTAINNAPTYANNSKIWAEGTDAQVQGLGGTHSAQGWAQQESSNYSVTATGSTTSRTLKDRFTDIINVKDFGAKGDGVTDDTAAFNAAGASGKQIYIPEGTYKLNSYINYPNFVVGRDVKFTGKTVHYKPYDNTYKKSIIFSMPREFSAYNDICTAMGETRLWTQGFDYDDDGNCYIAMDGNGTTYTAIIKLNNQYNYVGWIKIPYGTENPTIVNKNSDLLLYIRSAGNARKLTEYDITNATWNGDYITGTDTAIDYYNTQCDYDNGTWYVLSAEANLGNEWVGRNWIKKYDDDFNYLGYIKLPMEYMGGANSNIYHYDMIKTQGFRVKDNEIYVSHGVGRRFTTIPDYKPSFDFGVSHFSADGKTLLQFSLLNEEKFSSYLEGLGYTVLVSETEGLAKHPDGSIHHLYTTDTDMFIIREFDDAGTDFSYMASTYNPVNLDDLQNCVYPVKLDTNGNKQYLDVVSGAQITQVSDFFEMMYNLDLQTLKINTQILNVTGADGLTLPDKSLCIFQNKNNSYIFCSVTPNTGEGAETGILFSKSGSTWIQNNKVKQSTYCFELVSDGTDNNRTYIRYHKGNDFYNPIVISDTGVNIGNYSGLYPGAQNVSVYVSNSSQDAYRRVWGANYSALYPGTSNTINLGNANNLWKEIFAANATINTSDERQKQNISDIDERVFKAWGKVEFKQFVFKDAVKAKGENARIHFGVIAQRVKEAFESEGLDGFKYGLLCYDEWEDEYENIEVIDKEAEYDEDGNEIVPAKTHTEKKLTQKAGNAYGIRYGEALALECAYQRWKLEQMQKQLDNLLNNGYSNNELTL